jgi:hypothetical protein
MCVYASQRRVYTQYIACHAIADCLIAAIYLFHAISGRAPAVRLASAAAHWDILGP